MKTKQETDTRLSQIEKEYAHILTEMLSATDSITINNLSYKLRQFDSQLRKTGLCATIKIGTEKIG